MKFKGSTKIGRLEATRFFVVLSLSHSFLSLKQAKARRTVVSETAETKKGKTRGPRGKFWGEKSHITRSASTVRRKLQMSFVFHKKVRKTF